MLHLPGNLAGNRSDMTVPESQQTRMKYQQQQQEQRQGQNGSFTERELGALFCMANADYKEMSFERFLMSGVGGGSGESVLGEVVNLENPVKPNFGCFEMVNSSFQGGLGSEMNNCAISRTSSCAPKPMEEMVEAAVAAVAVDGGELSLGEKGKVGYSVGRESFKKRKPEKMEGTKIQKDTREKKIRQSTEDEDSKITEQRINNNNNNCNSNNNNNSKKNSRSRNSKNNNSSGRETSVCTSKENSKAPEGQKTDYIHVRARRGQATDSHSLAERARREKISERMKYLQDLVPGCNKITGKAGMLDEIINYVQSLQRQVEFLSLKLASINPRLDFSIGNLFCKEMFPAYTANFPTIETASEISDASYIQFNPGQQVTSCSGLDVGINPNAGSQRTVNTPNASIPSVFLDSSCLTQQLQPTLNWETSLPSIFNLDFHQGAATSFPAHQFAGQVESTHLKMEM